MVIISNTSFLSGIAGDLRYHAASGTAQSYCTIILLFRNIKNRSRSGNGDGVRRIQNLPGSSHPAKPFPYLTAPFIDDNGCRGGNDNTRCKQQCDDPVDPASRIQELDNGKNGCQYGYDAE